jgi:putative transposase
MKKREELREILCQKIKDYSNTLWKPINIIKTPKETNSWFQINEGKNKEKIIERTYNHDTEELKEVKYRCKKKVLLPTEMQKKVLLSWMNSYAKMYNATLKFIKSKLYTAKKQRKSENIEFQKEKEKNNIEYENIIKKYNMKGKEPPKKKRLFKKIKITLNFKRIRTIYMLKAKDEIQKISGIDSKMKIHGHILDCAIQDVCTAYKTAFTNMRNGYIKRFRIRYLKESKGRKFLRMEQSEFSKSHKTFCVSGLGETVKTTENNEEPYKDVKCGGTIVYDENDNRFTLYVPIEEGRKILNKNKGNSVAMDCGVKTFQVGYSESKIIEISPHLRETMKKYLKNIDSIEQSQLSDGKKKRATNKRYKYIKNCINDLHWKSIKYLTDNFETIQIGNLSTKAICKKEGKLDKMTKRVAILMSLYVFKERLKYKCYLKCCKYKEINECYTSKTCTLCGYIKKDLGNARVFECNKCYANIERDINGARNIYMLGILEEK